MVMGVIILIPLLSADTWFDKDPLVYYVTIDFLSLEDLNAAEKY